MFAKMITSTRASGKRTAVRKYFFSYFRCMKKRTTSEALVTAIATPMMRLAVWPMFIRDWPTVRIVATIRQANTAQYSRVDLTGSLILILASISRQIRSHFVHLQSLAQHSASRPRLFSSIKNPESRIALSKKIDDRKQEDPHEIDEVPVERDVLDLGVPV